MSDSHDDWRALNRNQNRLLPRRDWRLETAFETVSVNAWVVGLREPLIFISRRRVCRSPLEVYLSQLGDA